MKRPASYVGYMLLKAGSLYRGLTEGCKGGHGELRKEAGTEKRLLEVRGRCAGRGFCSHKQAPVPLTGCSSLWTRGFVGIGQAGGTIMSGGSAKRCERSVLAYLSGGYSHLRTSGFLRRTNI